MQRLRIGLLLCTLAFTSASAMTQDAGPDASVLDPYRDAATARWEDEIKQLEQLDETETDPADGVLLIGSSSIRLWKNSAVDMAPYRTIRRGYGGAKYSDLAVYAQRIIQPHHYRAVVMFVANDVSGSKDDHTPEQVEKLVRYIIDVSRQHQPDAAIFVVEVTPTPRRFDVWPQIRQLNARLREITQTESNTYFIATADHYLDRDDVPLADLFIADGLHQNETGYEVWSVLIRRRLDEVLRMLAKDQAHAETDAATSH